MKRNEFMQVKGLDLKELKVKALVLTGEIANLTLDKNMKKLKDLKIVSKKKKELAQILTVIKQKELLTQVESRIESLESSKEIKEQPKIEKKVTAQGEKAKVTKGRRKGEKS